MQGISGPMQQEWEFVLVENLIPEDHLVRKLHAILDLDFIHEETRKMYSKLGRPGIDPVVLVKYLLIGYLFGIPSERQIEWRIRTDFALRWYLGLNLSAPVPDHSTISQNRRRRPAFRKVFRRLFEEVVRQCVEAGLVSGRIVGTDSTHVKAYASRASEYLAEVTEEPGVYWERLDQYEELAQEDLARKTGRLQKKRVKQIKRDRRHPHRRMSRTDPEAGYLNRPGKPKGMHYLSHQTVDTDHGVILDVAVTSGDVSDAAPYLNQLERVHREIIPIQTATADAIYDFPLAHHVLGEHGINFFVRPIMHHEPTTVDIRRDDFTYDEEKDCYLCPSEKQLHLNTLQRSSSGLHWVYSADKKDCQACPLRENCLSECRKNGSRKLERSWFEPTVRRDLDRQAEPEYREALRLRQIWCEGTFAAQKWGHNLTRVLRRGLEAAEDHCLLSATAMNLKQMIKCLG
jgi:transposase